MLYFTVNIESTKTAPKREVAAPKVAPARVGDAERLVTNRPISPPGESGKPALAVAEH